MTKRFFDVCLSLVGIILLSPVFAAISLAIMLGAPGPVFYRGRRTGLNGVAFHIFKFRTMIANADQIGGPSTADGDPRVTAIGWFLRKHKLDELPQLFNVLFGEMSIVGPRPEVPMYTDLFTQEERRILSVRPGITDWATLWNPDEGALLGGEPDPEKAYLEKIRPTKIKLQLKYVDSPSMAVDLKIVFSTIGIIIRKASGGRHA